jgi:beta-phosphoglucomutase-like phosphatase (HAD superfamily)
VVEDSLPGIQAGLAASMRVFSLHPPEGLPADVAARVHSIGNLHQLQACLS